jgi:8-oxo-dGTP pyrophosphatase MutT (NUDIX family)
MNEQSYYRVSVKGVVIDEQGRYLLSLEDNGKWELLGGGLDHGEDPRQCLEREIKEETGLVITSISENPIHFITAKRENADTYIANVIYEITLKDLDFTPSDECQELRFVKPEDMASLDLFSNVRKLAEVLVNQ